MAFSSFLDGLGCGKDKPSAARVNLQGLGKLLALNICCFVVKLFFSFVAILCFSAKPPEKYASADSMAPMTLKYFNQT